MSLATQVTALASRIATEFKSVRSAITGKEDTIASASWPLDVANTYWRGDKTWQTLLATVVPNRVAITGLAGVAATAARADHVHPLAFGTDLNGASVSGTTVPSAFSLGINFTFASNDPTWPATGFGLAVTLRHSAQRTMQTFYDKQGTVWTRSEYAADTWTTWLLSTPNWAKQEVRVVATSNITLSGTQTIDGVAVVAGDRVLVTGQTSAAANGIYVAAAGAWARAGHADTATEIAGAVVSVLAGTTYGGSTWTTSFKSTNSLGTTAMVWDQLLGLNQANGLYLTPSQAAALYLTRSQADALYVQNDTGWVDYSPGGGSAAGTNSAGWQGAANFAQYRIVGKIAQVRLSRDCGAAITYSGGNYTNQTVTGSGLPNAACPAIQVSGTARWNDIPVTVVISTTGVVQILGGPPGTFPAGSTLVCDFLYTLG